MDLSVILMCRNGNKKTREKPITNSTLFDFANRLRFRLTALMLLGLVCLQVFPEQNTLNAEEFQISLQSGTVITVDVKKYIDIHKRSETSNKLHSRITARSGRLTRLGSSSS